MNNTQNIRRQGLGLAGLCLQLVAVQIIGIAHLSDDCFRDGDYG